MKPADGQGKYKLLYVDDERDNLKSFQALFRREYEIFLAASPREALDVLRSRDIDILITDQRMPDMSGSDLLVQVAKHFPHVHSYLLTAYSDFEPLVHAINEGKVQGFFAKPLDPVEIVGRIRENLELNKLRKRNVELLQEVEAGYSLLRIAERIARFGAWRVYIAEDRVFWSDGVAMIHEEEPGFSPKVEEGVGYYAPEWRERISNAYAECATHGVPFDEEMEIITAKGNRVWVRTMGEAVRDESGAVIEVRGAFQDISGRKTMEAELLCAHKEMTQLMETLPSFLISLDKAGRVVRWNREAGRLFGLEGAAVRGRLLAECNVSWKWPVVERALSQALEDGESVRLDDQPFTHLDGTPGYLGMTVNNIEQADNGHQCILIMGRDITRVKMLESQLVQAQKMEAIGQLSAGIAHEINTPIQFVGNNLSFLKDACGTVHELLRRYAALCDDCRKLPEMADKIRELDEFCRDKELGYLIEETSTSIQEIAAGVERVAGIVRSMRMVSHPGRQEMALVDLNAVVGTVVDITRHEWKNVLEMETRLQPDLPMVLCLVTEIYQALLNIVVNAIYAVTEMVDSGRSSRGRITISTRQDGNWAEIRIADTGSGIAPEIQDRIFDPFFTTKEVGEGTGQGLPIAHTAIVKQHGGMLFFESKPGQGTTFIVRLPMESEG